MKWVAATTDHRNAKGCRIYSALNVEGLPVANNLGASEQPGHAALFDSYGEALRSAVKAERMYTWVFKPIARVKAVIR